jgi:hypothetical protein
MAPAGDASRRDGSTKPFRHAFAGRVLSFKIRRPTDANEAKIRIAPTELADKRQNCSNNLIERQKCNYRQ